MNTLPEGWARARVGEIGEVRLGKMLDKAKNQGEPAKYLRNINVRWFRFDLSDLQTILVDSDERELLSVHDGDLFVCEGGEPGRCAVWRGGENDLVYQKALHRIRTASGIVPELLMYRLRHEAEHGGLQEAFTGTTIKHLTRESLSRYEISLPPQNEQKRLAAKLGALLTRVDACRERLGRVPLIIKQFRQSILATAMLGQLTKASRPNNYENWKKVKLSDLAELITKGSSPKWQGFSYQNSGTLFVTSENVREMKIDISEAKYVDSSFDSVQRRSKLQRGDLLTNIVGASIGRTAIYDFDLPANINQAVCVIRLKKGVNNRFVMYAMNSLSVLEHMHGEKVDVARANLSLQDIGDIPLMIPKPDEQDEIVRRIEILLSCADRLEEKYKAAHIRVEQLTPALLSKAFSGELVPQEPKDEPASVLLKRIRASRALSDDTKEARGGGDIAGKSVRTRKVKKPKVKIIMLKRKDVEPSHLSDILKAGGPLSAESLWSASQLDIDDFYDQLKEEEARGLLREIAGEQRLLEAA